MANKMKSYLGFMLMIGLVFGIFYALGMGLVTVFLPDTQVASSDQPALVEGKRTNILLLGVDARPGDSNSRSDTMILASIDPNLKKVALVSIPRDTQVNVQGSTLDKINSANYVGGPKLAVEKVQNLMGEKIDYYVEMDFQGFKRIIDTLGGVTINVDQRMYKPSEDIDLKPGLQRLDGSDALAFVRFRGYVMGDIDRTTHQQAFIKALGQELLKPSTITKLPQLIRQANTCVDTNLRLTDMLKMATWAPGFSAETIVAQTLPGYFYDQRDAQGVLTTSYWIADSQQAKGLLDNMMEGKTVAVLVDTPASNQSTTGRTSDAKTKTVPQPSPTTEQANRERANLPSAGHGVEIKEKQV